MPGGVALIGGHVIFARPAPEAQFFNEVRAEARKVTWTSRRETWITSVMVAIMVGVSMFFFWMVDAGVSFSVNEILKLAAGA